MYKIVVTKEFFKKLKKLDNGSQKLIKKYIENNIRNSDNPKSKGKPLRYNLNGYWRYRIGDYRLICEIKEKSVVIVLIDIGHRKNIYK